jgi:hypothetical protein
MDSHTTLLPKIIDVLVALQNSSSLSNPLLEGTNDKYALLKRWIREEYNAGQLQRCVSIFHQFITMRLLTCYPINPNKDDMIIKATKTLGIFEAVNNIGENLIPYTEFYNDAINEQLEIKEDFPHWKAKEG